MSRLYEEKKRNEVYAYMHGLLDDHVTKTRDAVCMMCDV